MRSAMGELVSQATRTGVGGDAGNLRGSLVTVPKPETWIARLALTNFRNHASAVLDCGREPIVLAGANGVGKTNILEAVSLLAPGQGLRRASFPDLARQGGPGSWAVSAQIRSSDETTTIGTGFASPFPARSQPRTGRIVRIDGEQQSGSGVLADYIDMLWLTPAMDGLFTGPAADRRRFLDRIVLCFDPAHRTRASQFERAMRQRNRLLETGAIRDAEFGGLERVLAETGVAIAAARQSTISAISRAIQKRRERASESPFPWAEVAIEGRIEAALGSQPAVDVEDAYAADLARNRYRDRAAGRTLEGPHRSDLIVRHGPKGMPAHLCSTGEQKALLIGFVLANAEMLAGSRKRGKSPESGESRAPVLLLDEIAAHLDEQRRTALFEDIVEIGSQAWMTGTDLAAFEPLENIATFFRVDTSGVFRC